jgi:tRNA(adenine34) deaminase
MIKLRQTNSSTPLDFMQLAYQLAIQAACLDEVPVGAVLTTMIDGQEIILAMAHNQTLMQKQIIGHAEMIALQQACAHLQNYRLNDCKMYITLEPCLMCAGAMINARIREVYYLLPDFKTGVAHSIYQAFDLPFNHHTSAYLLKNVININDTNQIMAQESLKQSYIELLQNFFQQKRLAKKIKK